jgi:transposase
VPVSASPAAAIAKLHTALCPILYRAKPVATSRKKPCARNAQGELRKLGEDVSEMLEYVPASFVVIRYVRTKLSCTKCDCIVQAKAPSRPIERGIAGPGLLAHVLVSKYRDHQPLYRQSEIYARQGVELERSTMADWVGGSSRLLEPLVDALHRYVIAAGKLYADDTPVPVLAPGQGKTKTGRLWTYVRDDRFCPGPSSREVGSHRHLGFHFDCNAHCAGNPSHTYTLPSWSATRTDAIRMASPTTTLEDHACCNAR